MGFKLITDFIHLLEMSLSQTDSENGSQDASSMDLEQLGSTRNFSFFALKLIFVTIAFAGVFILYGASFDTLSSSNDSEVQLTSDEMDNQVEISFLDTYSDIEEGDKETLFETFKTTFSKVYVNEKEESEKYQNFKDFLALIDERNLMEKNNGGTAIHGITKFADISQDDFEKTFLGYVEDESYPRGLTHVPMGSSDNSTNSSYVNWAGIYTTSINDQVCNTSSIYPQRRFTL